jgi:hypothetical protein
MGKPSHWTKYAGEGSEYDRQGSELLNAEERNLHSSRNFAGCILCIVNESVLDITHFFDYSTVSRHRT